ncbi:MAG: hypothetical protein ACKVVT_03150 [Dehalococcoidia bacterium]
MGTEGRGATKFPPLTEEMIREALGDPAELREATRLADLTMDHARSHWREITTAYPDQWVALYGCRVVASSSTRAGVVAALRAIPDLIDGVTQLRHTARPAR